MLYFLKKHNFVTTKQDYIKLMIKKIFTVLYICAFCTGELLAENRNTLYRLTSDRRIKAAWIKTDDGQKHMPNLVQVTPTDRYDTIKGYGYDFLPSPNGKTPTPYYFSVQVPDGNYRVTVTIGDRKKSGITTVRAESRRLFLENIETKKGEFKTFTFVVNKRTPIISGTEVVHIKKRERSKLNWDDKLTIEINGKQPLCAAIQIERDEKVPTVFLTGNSTVVDQDEEPWASWGQMIPRFFNEKVCFANYAESGESANTFIAANRLKKALSQMKAGDYMFMEFGHNDQKQKGPGKGAFYSFATSLKTFIDEIRLRGGHPVLVTPTRRRSFKDGKIRDTHLDYPDAIHWLAEKENVPLIDLQEMTRILFETLGENESKKAFVHYPAGTFPNQTKAFADNTHFNPYGAYEIAKCVIEEMKRIGLPLTTYLRNDYSAYNPATPDNPETFHWDASPFVELEKPDGN